MNEPVQVLIVLDVDVEVPFPIDEVWVRVSAPFERREVLKLSQCEAPEVHRFGTGARSVRWDALKRATERLAERTLAIAREAAKAEQSSEFYICGQAPLPLFAHLGRLLTARLKPQTLLNRRKDGTWDIVPLDALDAARGVFFDVVSGLDASDREGRVAIFVSTLGQPAATRLFEDFFRDQKEKLAGIIEIRTSRPTYLDAGNAPEALRQVSEVLSQVSSAYPRSSGVALFLAGPAPLAYLVGRAAPNTLGDIWLTNYDHTEERAAYTRVVPAPASARPWSGPITEARLDAVTVFSSLALECSPGINVIIGENGTGKTHLLKCMYAMLRATEDSEAMLRVPQRGDKLERVLAGRSRSLFAGDRDPSRVSIECERARFERVETAGAPASWSLTPDAPVRARALFLPSREVLMMYTGFERAYEDRELSFDETYYDLCKELSRRPRHESPPELAAVLEELERIVGGPVRLDMDSFAVDTKRGPIPAPMVAEGHRKLATLAYLIKNGALTPESVLFWDEPEANLNPKLVTVVARVVRQLAHAGVQIFVATHDYLLAREISMSAEYRREPVIDTRFFALHRTSDDGPVERESGAYWGDLQCNPIVEEYAAHYEREQDLFAGGSQKEQRS